MQNSLRLPLPRLVETSFATPLTSLPVLTDKGLYEATHTRIAFSNRLGGTSPKPYSSLNLGNHVGDMKMCVRSNRRTLLDVLGAGTFCENLINPNQVHGTNIVTVDTLEQARSEASEGADGIVCSLEEVPVLLCFADCVPVISVAPDGSFGVFHAGWRGALAGIVGKGLQSLAQHAGCEVSECNTYIGPHIGSCCYEVGEDVLEQFVERFGSECAENGNHLNLSAAVIKSLLEAGAVPQRIIEAAMCTSCNSDRYFSYRAEGGTTGRHGAIAFKEGGQWD